MIIKNYQNKELSKNGGRENGEKEKNADFHDFDRIRFNLIGV